MSGSRGRCPFCTAEIQVPEVTFTDARPKVTVAEANKSTSGEETVYAGGDVTVTTARVICDGTTYALRNITSVKMGITPANPNAPRLMVLLGGLLLFCGLAEMFHSFGEGLMLGLLGAGLFGGGFAVWNNATADYHLAIASSSGEVQAYTSTDRQKVEQIVAAVNEAIVRYR
jgi:hypothetical protein